MRAELERLQFVEAHVLTGAVPTAEWAQRAQLDPELEVEAHAQRQLYRGLRAAGRQQLRHELAQIHERLYGGAAPWGWWARLRQLLAGKLGGPFAN